MFFLVNFLLCPGVSLQAVHLDIRVGERTNNYTEIAAKDKLPELWLRVRQLAEQVHQIQREQDYQRVSLCVVHLLDLFWSFQQHLRVVLTGVCSVQLSHSVIKTTQRRSPENCSGIRKGSAEKNLLRKTMRCG